MEIKYLLINQSSEKVPVFYNGNSNPFLLPKIGARPPYFYDPRYEPYYPLL